jgi:hypothetical protein
MDKGSRSPSRDVLLLLISEIHNSKEKPGHIYKLKKKICPDGNFWAEKEDISGEKR